MYMYVYSIKICVCMYVCIFSGKNTPIYMPDPTWANHLPMAKDAGLSLATYRYTTSSLSEHSLN